MNQLGALDFAGGAVVHVNAGVAALVCATMLGRRRGYGTEAFEPHSLGWTAIGTALLLFGWFGFNAGSALSADGRAALAFVVTLVAAAAGGLAWMLMEWVVRGAPTLLGLLSGLIGGLVAITPAAGFVQVGSAALMGLMAGVVCFWGATWLKRRLGADDSLDVFGVHGVGGIAGSVLTAVFADPVIAGTSPTVLNQLVAVLAVAAYSAVGTAVLLFLIRLVMPLRVDSVQEMEGLDISLHLERQH